MTKTDVAFTVNGQKHHLRVEPHRSLLQVLREDLNLTGTKQACDGGECGSCTVLLDGKAAMACLLPISRVAGKDVVTIEGLGTPQALHPLQEAFLVTGAVQCGFCTPGMIMQAKALLDANPHPSRADIVRRLSRNLCRCTGYVKIIDAILYAAHLMAGGEKRPVAQGTVGASVERVEGRDKVTGLTHYAADLKMEGMLHARVLWSPHHHARIDSLETTEAEKLPGVAAVLTAKDIPGLNCMRQGQEGWPVLAQGEVCFQGDAIALVAAESEEVAAQALSLIKVEYQPLPVILDALEALKPGAPQLWPKGNLDYTRRLEKGNIQEGFAQADVIVENTYTTPFQEHAYMEPDASVSHMDDEGRVVVYAPTQTSHMAQKATARLLGLPEEKVRVIPTIIGGGFGGKYAELNWHATALLAYKTKRPVKLVFTREETLLYTKKRQPTIMTYRTGATKDGRLVALYADMVANGGAYPTGNPASVDFHMSVLSATGPYRIPHVLVKGRAAATNTPKHGPMRGLGGITYCFALESQMDLMAQRLGMDPLEFRLKNLIEVGDKAPWGQVLDESVGIKKTLELLRPHWQAAHQAIAQETKDNSSPIRRGVGLACMWKSMGGTVGNSTDAFVELHEDGSVETRVGMNETGQGTFTVLAQFVAQEIGVPYRSIVITGGDTALTPEGGGGYSRGTYVVGNAVREAAANLKAMLLQEAAQVLEEPEASVALKDGYAISTQDPSHRIPLARLASICRGKGTPLAYKGVARPRVPAPYFLAVDNHTGQGVVSYMFSFASQMAVVEVNTQTGEVKVPRFIFSLESGTVVHPINLEGQLEGSILQGLGFALMEGFVPGESKNFKKYVIPTTKDTPQDIIHIFITDPVPSGPYGAKGAGENANIATPAAILNAIAHAIDGRVYDLPATPKRVLTALQRRS